MDKACKEYVQQLHLVFASEKNNFSNSDFKITLADNDISKSVEFNKIIGTSKKQIISIAKEKKTPDTEIKKTLCKTIDETGNKFYWHRKYYKELILNIKSELKLNFEEEYEEKLKHLDDVRPGEDTSFPTANTTTSDNGRQIDIEQLKTHFKAPFKKEGGGFETLLTMLRQENNPKFFAMIASEIYNSKYFFKGDFPTFAMWYKEFCKLVQCECVLSYKQSKLKPSPSQSAAFGFLHI